MRLAVIGTRSFHDKQIVFGYLDKMRQESDCCWTIVTGGAQGADKLAAEYARIHKLPLIVFRPDWVTHGKKAGPLRNRQIINESDAVVAFWDGVSPGTKSSLLMAKQKGIPVIVVSFDGNELDIEL